MEWSRRLASSFFFSSRRRHTRFDCDWSSDVCSSDLTSGDGLLTDVTGGDARYVAVSTFVTTSFTEAGLVKSSGSGLRSEERRVGKECRSRWSAYHKKKR